MCSAERRGSIGWIFAAVVLTGAIGAAVAAPPAAPDASGTWLGKLTVGAVELRLGLIVSKDDAGKLQATLNSIDQGGMTLPADEITVAPGGATHFAIKLIGASFDGKLAPDRSAIEGTFAQGGGKLPLKFEPVSALPTVKRPQEPKKPYPYKDEQVTFENKDSPGVKLAATLTLPKTGGPHPAVVLITGSGPQDRDEMIVGHRPFLVLADHLTRNGIAVLRYDDRGVGKSTGDFAKATSRDFAGDALAAVAFLKTRKDIDAKRIGLIGHSEGGVVGPLAAARAGGDVAFMVLLAGVGVPMDQLLLRQVKDVGRTSGIASDMLERMVANQKTALAMVKQSNDPAEAERKLRALIAESSAALTAEQRKALSVTEGSIDMQVKMMTSAWFRELLRYDPTATLAKVKCPVLAINGAKDVQVAADANLPAIRDALKKAGNADVETVELPGLNHLFQECKTGGVAEYASIEQTMSPQALEIVTKWVRRRAGLDKPAGK
jgi:uncharacterized protein